MSDTQWPRYQVFVQPESGGPFFDWGSVHAPDNELALLNARDVFARRPAVAAIWVVLAEAIYSQTRQELEARQAEERTNEGGGNPARRNPVPVDGVAKDEQEPYYVFCKPKAAGTQTLLGMIEASQPLEAMQRAVETFSAQFKRGQAPYAWWVFPARLRFQNDPGEADSLFAPALDKPFRLSTDFHVVTELREMRRKP